MWRRRWARNANGNTPPTPGRPRWARKCTASFTSAGWPLDAHTMGKSPRCSWATATDTPAIADPLFARLELRLLQPRREVDGDRFPLAELVHGVRARLAEPVAGRL